MLIRDEIPSDIEAIYALTKAAFAPMPYSSGTEPVIIDALRQDGDLSLSLVGVMDGLITAQITFSPVTAGETPGNWFGLGPVSVAPDQQSQGLGAAIIREGLSRIKAMGAEGCVLVGNPAYYSRFGFKSGQITYGEVPAEFVQWLSFGKETPKGEVRYSPGFDKS